MGWFRDLRQRFTAPTTRNFSAGPLDALIADAARRTGNAIGRTEALSVPAVLRGRNMLAAIATLPLVQYGPNRDVASNPLFSQLDPDVPNVVTLSQTIEDLLFEGVSWWRITGFGFDGYPMTVRHLDVGTVSVQPPTNGKSPAPLPSGIDPRGAVVYVDGTAVPASDMIRFDSPNPGLLKIGGRAIRRALLLDQAAAMYAEDPRPLDYFTPTPGAEAAADDDVQTILGTWKAARRTRSTAYVPAALEYHTVDSPSPANLQLAELQRQAALDIANALGIDPEDLGISTTSRTYQNAVDRRQDRINETLAPYMRAITDRLSMGDVTKRGYYVAFDLDDYLKSNPTERWNVYQTGFNIGALTKDEIRAKEGLPPLPAEAAEPPAEPATTVQASRPAVLTFDAEPNGLRHFSLNVAEFAVDTQARTITGTVMPYGPVAAKYGMQFRFAPDSLKWTDLGRVKLNRDHDVRQSIGYAIAAQSAGDGLKLTFKVARGPEGDAALSLAEDGVLDGLSAGVEFTDADTIPDPKTRGVTLVRRADLRHAALTAEPAFDDARVTRVHASRTEGNTVEETTTEPTATAPVVAPAVTQFDAATVVALLQNAMNTNQSAGISQTQGPAATPEVRQTVNPTRVAASVTEPPSYVFDRRGILRNGAHDFGLDLISAIKGGNPETPEYRRALEFAAAQFDVVSTDVNELNPTINVNRYIDQRDYQYPIWNAVNKGTPPNGIQPFGWPKYSSSSGLVGNHTEGTEPSSGTYVTTSQTVTPTALSGKAKLSREVWDMGGMPGISDLIWRQIQRSWYEALEAAIVATLDAASPAALATFTAGGGTTGQTLVSEMRKALAGLHFVRGGFRFDTAFSQIDLYQHLTGALDGSGRPLLPAVGPTNADGTVNDRYQSVNVNGVPFLPAWALAATGSVAASSYLIDRGAVDGWASAPQRLDIVSNEVANVYIGVFGYKATAINDINGVREITYDPVP